MEMWSLLVKIQLNTKYWVISSQQFLNQKTSLAFFVLFEQRRFDQHTEAVPRINDVHQLRVSTTVELTTQAAHKILEI